MPSLDSFLNNVAANTESPALSPTDAREPAERGLAGLPEVPDVARSVAAAPDVALSLEDALATERPMRRTDADDRRPASGAEAGAATARGARGSAMTRAVERADRVREPACTYLLPIRRVGVSRDEIADFAAYFAQLGSAGCEVLVVDGSPPEVWDANDRAWSTVCRHVRVDPRYTFMNGKVNGVHTGVDLSSTEKIVLADDDIRYTPADVARMCELLDEFELVRPQNFLHPLPPWARLEAARMLINRGVLPTGDYPGTCGFRRGAFRRVGPYDGDVLFDNEEMVRHFALEGASVAHADDFFILKRPPSLAKWREQRPRQAYEDFVMRAKTAFFLALLPALVLAASLAGVAAAAALSAVVACASIALAARGRRGAAGLVFPRSVCLWAPLWVLERAVSVYWALWWRFGRGGYPFGARVLSKGTGRAWVEGGRVPLRVVGSSSRGVRP